MFLVYYSNFKKSTKISQLIGQPVPKSRAEYLSTIADYTRRGQSRAVFVLLQLALKDMGATYNPEDFYVEENGKWKLKGDKYLFSLSHSGDAVAVAVVDSASMPNILDVGIDIEEISPRLLKVEKFITNWANECGKNTDFSGLDEWAIQTQLTKLWCKRESQIKCEGEEISSFEFADDWQTYRISISVKSSNIKEISPIIKQIL